MSNVTLRFLKIFSNVIIVDISVFKYLYRCRSNAVDLWSEFLDFALRILDFFFMFQQMFASQVLLDGIVSFPVTVKRGTVTL